MIKRVFAVNLIALMILSTFVLAAGSSSGNARVRDTPVATTTATEDSTATTCEDKATVKDRIKCRFENKEVAKREAYGNIEEACRDAENSKREACQKLYKNSASCYDLTNAVEKKRCFLKESGININAGGTFRAAPDETKRNYVVLLLYDIQEKIEAKAEEGKITTDQATSLVTKIVEIKKMIIAGEKRATVTVKMQEFKTEFREVMSTTTGAVA